MVNIDFKAKLQKIIEQDTRYPDEAYVFINSSIKFTVEKRMSNRASEARHVDAKELIGGVVEFALQQFGPLSWEVLSSWNIKSPADVGNVVYNMIREKLLAQGENDSKDDFNIKYNIQEALTIPANEKTSSDTEVPIIA